MAAIASIGSNNPNPIGGLPTPVLLALVGGGIGAVVLLRRKLGNSTASATGSSGSTLLPNTAIMLGSLQQSLLDLSGQTGKGFSDTQSMVTGVGENIGLQLDAMTAQQQQALIQLQNTLTNHYDANTSTIMDAVKAQGDTLSAIIGSNSTAQAAANKSLAESLIHGLDLLTAQHNAELSGISAIGGKVDAATGRVTGLSDSLNAQLSALNKQISGVQTSVDTANLALAKDPTNSWLSAFNGKYFLQQLPNGGGGGMMYVTGGRAYNVSWSDYVNATGKTVIDNQTSFWASPAQYDPIQKAGSGVLSTNGVHV